MFTIKVKKSAVKSIKELSGREKERVREVINTIELDPVPFKKYDLKKLKGRQDTYRIRAVRIRIVYEVKLLERLIIIDYIGFREKAYWGRG